ncbi:hypothetical protein VF21_02524 [Pseudogymnoascus sp. 05NY08]|nr:hypothetical protein VF21_02524 [Pseudogymnoascus sp. 05NY08]
MITPPESVSNETQLERYDEWLHQVNKVRLAELPGLKGFENISHVSHDEIRGIREDSSGKWAGLSEEAIRHMVIKIKLKKRAKRKYDLFLRLQKRAPSDSTTSHQFSARSMQIIRTQARKYGIGTEAVETRETVAQLAFWDHEKDEFAKFEQDFLSTQSNNTDILPLDEIHHEKEQSKGSSEHQRELEQFSETMPRNERESTTGPSDTPANGTKAGDLLGTCSEFGFAEIEAMEQAKVLMPTYLALSRGFGGATLCQMMGIGDDEQLVERLVCLGPESAMLDKQPEFAPGETTWETLKNMPLD